ncbi:MAG: 50S ribosomal protein L11 methyltransferase [Bacteroidales bacterium]|nr:50S ribosomal protein L11 methyltransferase [Bacteroidales bacterium]
MNYYLITIPIPDHQDRTDMLIAELGEAGFESFEETETQLLAYIPEKDYKANLMAEIEYCQLPEVKNKITTEFINDRNWNELWESNYPPVMISETCIVRAPFHECPPNIEYDIVIKPKMAFGTAHHETTAQMLKVILKLDIAGKRVLDMGCGSGVLAILCSMKGTSEITAIDFDEWSVSNTIENSEINHIQNITILLGDADLLKSPMEFDVVLANINKNILLRDIPAYVGVLAPGGSIYFSGFYTADLKVITSVANTNHLTYIDSCSENNWVVAHFIKE